jgi:hypothetical protein
MCRALLFYRSKQHSKQYASKSIITIELNNRKIVSNTLYEIETSLLDTKAAKIIYRYRILNDNNQVVCLGETIQVFLDSSGNLQLYTPDFFQQWKNRLDFVSK